MKFNAVMKEESRRLVTESQSSARRRMRDGAWLLVAMTTLQGCWMFREAESSIAERSQQRFSEPTDPLFGTTQFGRSRTIWGDFKLRSALDNK
jgi:hypothetical protein